MAFIEINDVSKRYIQNDRAFKALDHVSLEIEKGEFICLLGPSGCGKTTILRTVAGQLRALGGSVELFGRDLAGMPGDDRARTMAVMLTGRPSTELTTCRDVVEAGRYPYTGRLGVLGAADDEAVLAAMEATGVSALAERDFAHVSDGQRQRVLLARAKVEGPKGNVLAHHRGDELVLRVLEHHAAGTAELPDAGWVSGVDAGDSELAGLELDERIQVPRERGLARAVLPDDRHELAGRHVERHVAQRGTTGRICMGDAPRLHDLLARPTHPRPST